MNYTIITGASSGIGYALAKIMAAKAHHLILVARSEDALIDLKNTLVADYAIQVEVLAMDLSNADSANTLYQACKANDWAIECLVNNAGYGDYGCFDSDKAPLYNNMLQLNVLTLTALTALFVKDMKALGKGRVLNVGSIASFLPIPNFAVYAASKAYVRHFSEALHDELKGSCVSVTLLSPGVTATGFVKRANMDKAANAQGKLMQADKVALAAYKAMMAGKLRVTPGWLNQWMEYGCAMMPSRKLLMKMAGFIMRETS
ncbi:MAG: SDR family oxidoreductase [Methylophilaceae bacterium]|jgi:short-subunit dehydrogenase|nr:MAG: SDR family oxidoreductase [Methylophilaceae bacterium]